MKLLISPPCSGVLCRKETRICHPLVDFEDEKYTLVGGKFSQILTRECPPKAHSKLYFHSITLKYLLKKFCQALAFNQPKRQDLFCWTQDIYTVRQSV